jgi:hypothetical protein
MPWRLMTAACLGLDLAEPTLIHKHTVMPFRSREKPQLPLINIGKPQIGQSNEGDLDDENNPLLEELWRQVWYPRVDGYSRRLPLRQHLQWRVKGNKAYLHFISCSSLQLNGRVCGGCLPPDWRKL